MVKYNEIDVSFFYKTEFEGTEMEIEGDIEIDESGDLQLTENYESAKQDAYSWIRSQLGQWRSHPGLGGNLEALQGKPNTRETGFEGKISIQEALNHSGRFSIEDVYVRAVPVKINQIDYFVLIKVGKDDPLVVTQSVYL